jgi:hypothetical protein
MAVCCSDGKRRDLEIGRQRHLQDIDLLIRWPNRLRIGTAQGEEGRVDAVPDTGVCVGGFERIGIKPVNPPQIG